MEIDKMSEALYEVALEKWINQLRQLIASREKNKRILEILDKDIKSLKSSPLIEGVFYRFTEEDKELNLMNYLLELNTFGVLNLFDDKRTKGYKQKNRWIRFWMLECIGRIMTTEELREYFHKVLELPLITEIQNQIRIKDSLRRKPNIKMTSCLNEVAFHSLWGMMDITKILKDILTDDHTRQITTSSNTE